MGANYGSYSAPPRGAQDEPTHRYTDEGRVAREFEPPYLFLALRKIA